MATKDWKKIDKDEWQSKVTGVVLNVEFGQVKNKPKKWYVFLSRNLSDLNPKRLNSESGFPTKVRALRFAKIYRASHK